MLSSRRIGPIEITDSKLAPVEFVLPCDPEAVAALYRQLRLSPIDLRECSEVIATDPALAAHVLHLTAQRCQCPHVHTHIAEGIVCCGREELALLCESIMQARVGDDEFIRVARRHAVLTAKTAHIMAANEQIDPATAYLAGLLHAIGGFIGAPAKGQSELHSTMETTLALEFARQWQLPDCVLEGIIAAARFDQLHQSAMSRVIRCACAVSSVRLNQADIGPRTARVC